MDNNQNGSSSEEEFDVKIGDKLEFKLDFKSD